MKKMTNAEIRQSFLDFFRSKDHKIVPSAPVIPYDDPTLLFTNAGMNQFKNIFLGLEKPQWPRIADTQKCIRVSGKHNDLEEVGKDTYHHTFFEMLGNWSFNDYYKAEAIRWAWELLTDVWQLPKEHLWATVFRDDDEAAELWKSETDIDPSRILRFDEKDNFWEMGETGPCGPCSEIHIDLGPERCDKQHIPGHVCQVNGGCARFIELWNLVFIQYNRTESGELEPLPARHVDTGMGFERIVAVLQGVASNYDTDLFQPLIRKIDDLTGVRYESYDGVAHRVIADHVRALSFAIADGALPSNEGRGYVLRRLLRRAARYGRKLEKHEPFIYKLVPVLVDVMGDAFPEIKEKHQYIAMVIKAEEESFGQTLDRGIEIFERTVAELKKQGKKVFPGSAVFQLYDTYGFPVDLTRLMAEEQGMDVDMEGFEREMEEQRRRAKEAQKFRFEVVDFFKDGKEVKNSEFVGYSELRSKVRLVAYHENEFLLDRTPFYGEAGGQIGDQGRIYSEDGSVEIRVVNAIRSGNRIIHIGEVVRGSFEEALKKPLIAEVDSRRRKATARNHTATHLLHKALKEVLGEHVNQAGSLVAPERLRFDFTHFEKLTREQLDRIEETVNEHVRRNHPVEVLFRSFEEAKKMGAIALFGEKYGDTVRIIKIDDYSMELCGGTHLQATGEIGYFRIVSESGVAAGIRRIEAVTGEAADQLLRREKHTLARIRELISATDEELLPKLEGLLEERKQLMRELDTLKLRISQYELKPLLESSLSVNGVRVFSSRVEADSVDVIKKLGDYVRANLRSGVGVLGSVIDGKPFLLCVVTDDLIKTRNLRAGDIIKQLARVIQGGGGGRPHMAQAGGKDASKLDEALGQAKEVVQQMIREPKA
jgi:alanyl-tRNA synthetase